MGYAILRTQKLKHAQAVRRSMAHALRAQDTPNADPARTGDNSASVASVDEALTRFNERLAAQAKVRSNAVLAVEYLVTASPEDMRGKTRAQQDAFFADAKKWLDERHGPENVVAWGIHRDETTPHMYAVVVPIDDKGKLNCRHFLGGAKALNEMQTDFAQRVGQQHGLQRGIEGSKARHTSIQAYYARANAAFEPMPEVKTPPAKLRPEPEKPGLLAGRDAKAAWEADHAKWEQERAVAQAQYERRQAEIQAQQAKAVEVARKHEAQAKEAAALKHQVHELRQANGAMSSRLAKFSDHNRKLLDVGTLFTPDEVRFAQQRKAEQEAEAAKQAAIAAERAAEAAKRERVDVEVQKRLEALKTPSRGLYGAAHVYQEAAQKALRDAGGDASRVEWPKVDAQAAAKAIREHGQPPDEVAKMLLKRSPFMADPDNHQRLHDFMAKHAAGFQAEYQEIRRARDRGTDLNR